MSDSIDEADGAHRAQHHGRNELAPEKPTPEPAQELTPEAIEEQSLRQRITNGTRSTQAPGGRDVRWVRAGDLLSDASGRLAGHGIALTHAVHRGPRDLLLASARRTSASEPIETDRASRLAPVDAFGGRRDNHTMSLGLRR
jgi:hypothetical protein